VSVLETKWNRPDPGREKQVAELKRKLRGLDWYSH